MCSKSSGSFRSRWRRVKRKGISSCIWILLFCYNKKYHVMNKTQCLLTNRTNNLKRIQIKFWNINHVYYKIVKFRRSLKLHYIFLGIKRVCMCTLLLSLYLLLHFDDLRRKMNHILGMLDNLFLRSFKACAHLFHHKKYLTPQFVFGVGLEFHIKKVLSIFLLQNLFEYHFHSHNGLNESSFSTWISFLEVYRIVSCQLEGIC